MISLTPCEALATRKRLELRYDGYLRVVEVHTVRRSKEGHWLMRVWQVRGGSVSNELFGWKLLRIDESFSAHFINEESKAPRPGYKRNDPAMAGGIKCQL
jgi:hypothetical protein